MGEVEPYARLAGIYDEIVVDPCFGVWATYLDRLWRSDSTGVGEVLDVCCGTGLLAAELIGRGYRVTGLDASAAMLDRARGLVGSEVTLIKATLPDLPVAAEFDAAVSTFDGLNYLGSADFRLTVGAVARRLRPGGWFVFDLHTDAMLDLAHRTAVIDGEQSGTTYVIHYDVDRAARTCCARIDVDETDRGRFTEYHLQHVHSDGEVRIALSAAGFELVAVTDEYTDVPAGADTLRATWIARRAGPEPINS